MTINNKTERNYRGKCLGWPVTSYGAALQCLRETREVIVLIPNFHWCFFLNSSKFSQIYKQSVTVENFVSFVTNKRYLRRDYCWCWVNL